LKKRTSFLNNEKGVALVMVLLILTVVTILGLALMGLTLNNMKMSSSDRTYQSTYYIAESGVTYTLDKMNKNIVNIYNDSTNKTTFFSKIDSMFTDINNELPYTNFEEAFGHKPEAKILIEKIGNQNTNSSHQDYKITSIGTIDNRSRTVEKQIRIKWVAKNNVEIPDTAVFVKEVIDLSGGADIFGNVGTNSSAPKSVRLSGGADISGTVYVGPSAGNDVIEKPQNMAVDFEIVKLPYIKVFNLPQFPAFPTNPIPKNERIYNNNNSHDVIYNGSLHINDWVANNYTLYMTEDLQFDEIYITSNNTLNIDIGSADRNIVLNHLNVPNGKINIIGTGKLTLYVNNNITMGAGSVINTTDEIENIKKNNEATSSELIREQIKMLDIFYKGLSLDMSGSQKIYGSLYARNANISLTGGSGFQGHIITGGGKIDISGGANAITQIFYAPNSNVNISGGGTIVGNIISKNLTISGGGSITYNNALDDDLPPIFGGATGAVSSKDILSLEPTREK